MYLEGKQTLTLKTCDSYQLVKVENTYVSISIVSCLMYMGRKALCKRRAHSETIQRDHSERPLRTLGRTLERLLEKTLERTLGTTLGSTRENTH